MTDVRTMYDKEFLYAYDLQGRDVTAVIERVKPGKLVGEGGKASKKPVIYFAGKEKGLALNITNARTIAGMYGSFEVEKWVGKAITMYATTTTFGSKTVDCIRIRNVIPVGARNGNGKTQGQKPATAPPPVDREPGADDDDAADRAAAAPTEDEIAAMGDGT